MLAEGLPGGEVNVQTVAGERAAETHTNRERLAYIDGLRAIAAMMVFLVHSKPPAIFSLGAIGESAVYHGLYGVTVFYVVSAYTLCRSLEPAFEGTRVSWAAYFLRRFFRIAPLYYSVILYVVWNRLSVGAPIDYVSVAAHLSFVNVIAPQYANDLLSIEWSVAVEWAFYLILPILVMMCRRREGIAIMIAASIVLLLLQGKLFHALGQTIFEDRMFTLPYHFYAFATGIVVYVAARDSWLDKLKFVPLRLLATLSFVAVTLHVWNGVGGTGGVIVAASTGITILCCASGGIANSLLSWKPLAFVGRISFSMYLLHLFVLDRFASFGWPRDLTILAAFGALLIVATLSFTLVERPGMQIGARLIRWMAERRRSPAAMPSTAKP
jgi:peptidoglycan/LPS O-acetylase OafA/YrhL